MGFIAAAVGLAGITLISVFLWLLSLSIRKKRLEFEKREQDRLYRRALARAREQEHQERLEKAESGHVPTILFLAKEAERRNTRSALYWYEKAAELDNIYGMQGIIKISHLHIEDLVLREKAKFWGKCAQAVGGNLVAKYETGLALIYGQGVVKDVDKGLEHIISAGEREHIESALFLGQWYQSKDNPSPNYKKSLHWNKVAASLGDSQGMIRLGHNYRHGIGVEADYLQSSYWYERAAEQGSPEGMSRAGEIWIERKPNGNAIAYTWLFMAAHFGWQAARPLRDKVANNIGVDSVVGLQSLAKPLIRKITDGKVARHSLIKAFNRIYKRKVPLPSNAQTDAVESGQVEGHPVGVMQQAAGQADNDSMLMSHSSSSEANSNDSTSSSEGNRYQIDSDADTGVGFDYSQTQMDLSFTKS